MKINEKQLRKMIREGIFDFVRGNKSQVNNTANDATANEVRNTLRQNGLYFLKYNGSADTYYIADKDGIAYQGSENFQNYTFTYQVYRGKDKDLWVKNGKQILNGIDDIKENIQSTIEYYEKENQRKENRAAEEAKYKQETDAINNQVGYDARQAYGQEQMHRGRVWENKNVARMVNECVRKVLREQEENDAVKEQFEMGKRMAIFAKNNDETTANLIYSQAKNMRDAAGEGEDNESNPLFKAFADGFRSFR